jgi:hypothetical protein
LILGRLTEIVAAPYVFDRFIHKLLDFSVCQKHYSHYRVVKQGFNVRSHLFKRFFHLKRVTDVFDRVIQGFLAHKTLLLTMQKLQADFKEGYRVLVHEEFGEMFSIFSSLVIQVAAPVIAAVLEEHVVNYLGGSSFSPPHDVFVPFLHLGWVSSC